MTSSLDFRRLLRRSSAITAAVRTLGVASTARWLSIRTGLAMKIPTGSVWRVRPGNCQHPVQARLDGRTDIYAFGQIFIDDEYASLRQIEDATTIVDLGANVGFASAYFLSCFPRASVLAVEPDDENASMCRSNLEAFGDRAMVLHGAAWSECTGLKLLKQKGQDWGTRVSRSTEEAFTVPAWDLETLFTKTGSSVIDLLKIDVEGAETEIFGRGSTAFLKRVRNLCIELHGPECERAFFGALSGYRYDLSHSGELTICRNLSCPS